MRVTLSILVIANWTLAAVPQIVLSEGLKASPCAEQLLIQSRQIFRHRLEGGTVWFERLVNLGWALEQSGANAQYAEFVQKHVQELVIGLVDAPSLRHITNRIRASIFESGPVPVADRHLICVLSPDVAQREPNSNSIYCPQPGQIVVVTPGPVAHYARNFVVNLFGSLDMAMGNTDLPRWAMAGYRLRQAGKSADEFWERFVVQQGDRLEVDAPFWQLAMRMRSELLLVEIMAYVYGADHPDTLASRDNYNKTSIAAIGKDMGMRWTAKRLKLRERGYLRSAQNLMDILQDTIARSDALGRGKK